MPALYELTNSYLKVLEMAESLDDGALKDTLDSIDEVIDDKAENIAKVLKEMDGQTLAISAEIKRLQERKATLENNSRNLKAYLQAEMEKVGKEKIKTELFSIGIQNNPPSVYVYNEALLPEGFFIPQAPKVDKKALKEELKHGEIPGAELTQTKGVRIR